jgi:hypothetical protein
MTENSALLSSKTCRCTKRGERMKWGNWWRSLFSGGATPNAPRRLDGRSKTLSAASMKILADGEPGWITIKEANSLFSPTRDQSALGEMDEVGKQNLASFASDAGCLFEFMPTDNRGYFIWRPWRVIEHAESRRQQAAQGRRPADGREFRHATGSECWSAPWGGWPLPLFPSPW